MDDDGMRRIAEHLKLNGLLGRTPRHELDIRLGPEVLDSRYENDCRALLTRARSVSEEICTTLERQCHELSALGEAGLSDRVRYLTAVGGVATAVDLELKTNRGLDRLSYLNTVHQVVDEWQQGATYDLSNLLGPLDFLPRVGRSREDILGQWIWLNLGDGGRHRYLNWVKSSMRFAPSYGSAILSRFGSNARHDEREAVPEGRDQAAELPRDRARTIAETYLAEHGVPKATGRVREVASWDEIDGPRPAVYGYGEDFWRSHWVVYLEQEGSGLRESLILAVHRQTGEIGYLGGAGDEG